MAGPGLNGTTAIALGFPEPSMVFRLFTTSWIYGLWNRILFILFVGAVATMIGLPYWHRPDAKVTTMTLKSNVYPPRLTLPHVGHPGIKNIGCDVSGQHHLNMAPAIPDDLNSETANPVAIETISTAGWLPGTSSSIRNVYAWADWVTVPHKAMRWDFKFDPSYDTARCGLGPGAGLWSSFDEATYCKGSETLYLDPTPKRACLGDTIAVLDCVAGKGRCMLPNGTVVHANGMAVDALQVYLSPFDSDIRAGPGTPSCDDIYNGYYTGTSSVSVAFGGSGSGKTLVRSGNDLVPETPLGSQHVDLVVRCNLSEADLPNATLVVGMLPMDASFVYNAKSNTLAIHESHKVTLSNDWRSVLIINVCLLCLAHWLSDVDKDANEPWTVVPEIIGLFSAAAGVYLQRLTNSVYHRCLDVANGPLAAEMVTWVVLLELAANVACLVVLRSSENGRIQTELGQKVGTVRKLSYECALLGSVFLQVVSASDSMFDAYMGFFVGAAFLYSSTYRALQTFVEAPGVGQHKNHVVIRTLAVGAFAVALYAFYVLAALPSVDPVAGLARHSVEGASLCASAVVVFGVVGLAERF